MFRSLIDCIHYMFHPFDQIIFRKKNMENYRELQNKNINDSERSISIQGKLNCKPDEIISFKENHIYSTQAIRSCMTYLRAIPDKDHVGATEYIFEIAMLDLNEENSSLVLYARHIFLLLLEENLPTIPYENYFSQELMTGFLQDQENKEKVKFILEFITKLFERKNHDLDPNMFTLDFILYLFNLAESNDVNELISSVISAFSGLDENPFLEELLPFIYEWIQKMLDSPYFPNGFLALSVLINPQIVYRKDVPQFNFENFINLTQTVDSKALSALLVMSKYDCVPILVPPEIVISALHKEFKTEESDNPNSHFMQALFMCLAKYSQLSEELQKETIEQTLEAFQTQSFHELTLIIGQMIKLPVDIFIQIPDLLYHVMQFIEDNSLTVEIMKLIAFVSLRAAELGNTDFIMSIGEALSPEFDFLTDCIESQNEKQASAANILYNIYHSSIEE